MLWVFADWSIVCIAPEVQGATIISLFAQFHMELCDSIVFLHTCTFLKFLLRDSQGLTFLQQFRGHSSTFLRRGAVCSQQCKKPRARQIMGARKSEQAAIPKTVG